MDSRNRATDVLEGLSAEILAADPADREVIVRIGTELESALGEMTDASAELQEVLALTLEALQFVYQGDVAHASQVMDAVAGAVAAAGEHLSDPADGRGTSTLKRAGVDLRGALESAGDGSPAGPDFPHPDAREEAQPQPTEADEPSPEDAADLAACLPEDADLDLMGEFIVECLDHISAAEASLLELEDDPDDSEQINTIFRAFHTIKGSSGFLGLDRIQRLAHLAESLLDRARDGQIRVVGGYADLSLKSCDTLRTMIAALEGVKPGEPLDIPDHYDGLLEQLSDPEAAGIGEEGAAEQMRIGDILVGRQQAEREDLEDAAAKQAGRRIGEVLVEDKVVSAAEVAKAIRIQKRIRGRGLAEATIRVGTSRLDKLIEMVGELVIAQSMVAQDPDVADGSRPRLVRSVSRAGKIIHELQDLTMALRMVPLKGTFQKMARLVRDLARKAGKKVLFATEGKDTEIDRNMVEVLNDPLIHMIRNALDHGIEPAQQRTAAGKDPTGTVRLRAYHSAGNVVLELSDDGKGLDREKIVAKAVERGLLEADRELSDTDAFSLIFQPGFSTAEKVTDVSGRGVGMDVVKKGIEALHGRADVTSTLGAGSTFTLRLPLTMAITDAMVARVGSQRYLLPTMSIEQSFRPEPGAISTVVGQGEMVLLRGDLVPVFRLYELFGVPDAVSDPAEALLIVIEADARRCALMVDELLGQQQVVIKSLGGALGHIPGVAGGAILGDGRVGLILDAGGILALAQTSAEGPLGPSANAA